MTHNAFKILSIDGGGIRGIYPAYILQCIQERLGIHVFDHFDMIAGTSTGSIIAAGIACQKPPSEIVSLYKKHGAEIFGQKIKSLFPPIFKQGAHSKYENKNLKKVLNDEFGDIKLGDIEKPLLIPATDIGHGGVHVFKSSYSKNFTRDTNVAVKHAVLASCSAPAFFDPVKIDNYLLADGGVWANNPALAAAIDAQYRLNVDMKDIRILSLGTGQSRTSYGTKDKKNWGLLTGWKNLEFISFLLSLQAQSIQNYLQLMLDKNQLIRLSFESDNPLPMDDAIVLNDLISRADRTFSHNSEKLMHFLQRLRLITMANKDYILTQISQTLDISPSDFKRAQKRFNAVKDWLIDGEYKSGFSPKIYLQGSFRLGTVVRPYKEDKDANFDIDQVCELSPKSHTEPSTLKNDIGNRLKENSNYLRMLDEEGKRCWTLEYFSDDNSPGFHLDILPSLSARNGIEYQIDITHKETNKYSWSKSNPNGYYLWFKSKNIFSREFMLEEKRKLYEGNRNIYNVLEDVPTQLLRSPLQRAIQIMKRHRDVFFSNKNNKPISIIITTITTHVRTSSSLIEVINEFVDYTLERYESWLKEGYLVCDGILDFEEGVWIVPNPVDQGLDKSKIENFADKWNSDDALPNAFFEWVRQLKRDINRFIKSGVSDDLNLRTKNIGDGDSYSELLKKEVQQDIESGLGSNQNLLQLIHLGIEGKVDWEFIKKVAQREYDIAENDDSKNVAKVNFYQVARHRGISLSEESVKDIITVLNYNKNSSRYVMCCNLLLGTATHEMVRKCITEYGYENILDWPIIRLYDFSGKNIFLPRKYS